MRSLVGRVDPGCEREYDGNRHTHNHHLGRYPGDLVSEDTGKFLAEPGDDKGLSHRIEYNGEEDT